jgi:hypothetical protein
MSKVTFNGGYYLTGTTAVSGSWRGITSVSASTVIQSATFADGTTAANMPLPAGLNLDVKIREIKLSAGGAFLAK